MLATFLLYYGYFWLLFLLADLLVVDSLVVASENVTKWSDKISTFYCQERRRLIFKKIVQFLKMSFNI